MNVLRLPVLGFVLLALCGTGCATTRKAYYNSWEKFGYAKRERLVDDVKDARDEQAKAKQQFASALEQFRSVVNFDGGRLEPMYNKLDKEYQRCEARATAVRNKTQTVKNVAGALFGEWQGEIGQIKDDPTLKDKSQALLDRTKDNYGEMIARMDAASASMDPVLSRFKNRVLFIKHNLNAQAVASLKGTEVELGGEIESLIREMESSIAEADEFIAGIQPQKS
jgi:hypothetical protein